MDFLVILAVIGVISLYFLRKTSKKPRAAQPTLDERRAKAQAQLVAEVATQPEVLIRTYTGKDQTTASVAYREEAAWLAQRSYYPASQTWSEGQWGCGAFALAALAWGSSSSCTS